MENSGTKMVNSLSRTQKTSFLTVVQEKKKKRKKTTPKCLLLHPPSIQHTGSKREDASSMQRQGQGRWRPWSTAVDELQMMRVDRAGPFCQFRLITPPHTQTNPIKLHFSRAAAEHKRQQLWFLFVRGPYGRHVNGRGTGSERPPPTEAANRPPPFVFNHHEGN